MTGWKIFYPYSFAGVCEDDPLVNLVNLLVNFAEFSPYAGARGKQAEISARNLGSLSICSIVTPPLIGNQLQSGRQVCQALYWRVCGGKMSIAIIVVAHVWSTRALTAPGNCIAVAKCGKHWPHRP